MTKEEYDNFRLRYKGCGACFPIYEKLSRFEKMWFTAIQKDVEELKKENKLIKDSYSLCKIIGEQKIKIADLEKQIEKMKRCEICKHHSNMSGCSYHSGCVKKCKENGMELFELKEIKEK